MDRSVSPAGAHGIHRAHEEVADCQLWQSFLDHSLWAQSLTPASAACPDLPLKRAWVAAEPDLAPLVEHIFAVVQVLLLFKLHLL